MGPAPVERVLLVGFMASGKSRVGRILAHNLGWTFLDFDDEISARVGLPIWDIFRQHGEAFFREEEGRTGAELLRERNVVLAAGGGWPAVPGRMDGLSPGTLSVWLQVGPEVAVERARGEGPTRPLLAIPDPVGRARTLLMERERFYRKADVVIDTSQALPENLAVRIEEILNKRRRESVLPLPPEA
jgi:shikimate kinase